MPLFVYAATLCAAIFLTGVWYGVRVFAPARRRTAHDTIPAPALASRREDDWQGYIKAYRFPTGMIDKARTRCPATTSAADLDTGLRQFLLACGSTPTLAAAMPSKTVDEAWHEFLTYTRDYAEFCERAFGRFLHHVPETTMTATELAANHSHGLLVSWIAACKNESLDLFGANTPTLFAADERAAALLGGYLLDGHKPTRYVGFCGKDRTKAATSKRCQARTGTICIRHAYAEAWDAFPAEFATVTPAPKPHPAKALKTTKASRGATPVDHPAIRRSSDYATDASAAVLATTPVTDHTPSVEPVAPPSVSHSSCGSSSHSSCGSSSSSCGGSSCGGGGCGGG